MSLKLPLTGKEPVEQLVEQYPQAVGFLTERGIRCLQCGEPFWGRLEELAEDLRGDEARFAEVLDELNAYLREQESSTP
jgi:methionine synthase II (cobalamin-independent)